jgi:hypothetical protein
VAPEPVDEVPVADAATDEDPMVFESRACSEHLVAKLTTNNSFLADIKSGYEHNSLFMKILKQPDQHTAFTIHDQLIWSCNQGAHVTKPEILVESMRSPWTLQGLHRD